MFDIEFEGKERVLVIEPGTKAHNSLKEFINMALMDKLMGISTQRAKAALSKIDIDFLEILGLVECHKSIFHTQKFHETITVSGEIVDLLTKLDNGEIVELRV